MDVAQDPVEPGPERLEEIIAHYLEEQLETGCAASVEALCRKYPRHATAIRRRLEFIDKLDGALGGRPSEHGSTSVPASLIGTRLSDRYLITREIGRGGMGVVYAARDQILERDVAIKLVPPTSLTPDAEQRLLREARTVARIDHPLICPVHDLGTSPLGMFFVMPLLAGTTLRDRIHERALQLGEILEIAMQMSEAAAHCHSQGIVHRDIKPENIMLCGDVADRPQVRVMDFGIARRASDSRITRSGYFLGTLSYLSPEQLQGDEPDARADIYALAAVIYECLCGHPPFQGDQETLLLRIPQEAPRDLSSLGVKIEPELNQLILRCLAKRPDDRIQSAAELHQALVAHHHSLSGAALQVTTVLTSLEDWSARRATTMVGRERELAELSQRMDAARSDRFQVALVGGSQGIGKTRLLQELAGLARRREVGVLVGRCTTSAGEPPRQAFCDLIRDAFSEWKLRGLPPPELGDLAPSLVTEFPVLGEISALRRQLGSGNDASPRASEDQIPLTELFARAFIRIAGERPLLIILEDIHASEEAVQILAHLARQLVSHPIFLTASFRSRAGVPEGRLTRLIADLDRRDDASVIRLQPLGPSAFEAFVKGVLGARIADEDLVGEIHEITDGNPLFAQALIESYVDQGLLERREDSTWGRAPEREITSTELPITVQEAIRDRVRGITETARDLLSRASVLGRRFAAGDLDILVNESEAGEEILEELLDHGLLLEIPSPAEDLLLFETAMLREVCYRGLTRHKRHTLHRRVAAAIEKRSPQDAARRSLILHHYTEAGDMERILDYGVALASEALDEHRALDAVRISRSALQALPWTRRAADDETEAETRLLLGRSLHLCGDLDRALEQIDEVVAIRKRQGHAREVVEATLCAADICWEARRIADAERWVREGLDLSESSGDTVRLTRFLELGGALAHLRGDRAEATSYFRRARQQQPGREEELAEGGRLVIPRSASSLPREPALIMTRDESEVLGNVFETLLAADEQGRLLGRLAESWRWEAQRRHFVIELRPGIRFHDGVPLTAEEVRRSLCRAVAISPPATRSPLVEILGIDAAGPRSDGGGGPEPVAELPQIVANGERQLRIETPRPAPLLPSMLTNVNLAIQRRTGPEDQPRVLGTGPFVLEDATKTHVVLRRHDEYWGPHRPRLESIEFVNGLDSSKQCSRLRDGSCDIARDLTPRDRDDLLGHPSFRRGLLQYPEKTTSFILLNTHRPELRCPDSRRALLGAVSAAGLVWQTLSGTAIRATGLLPPGILGHDPGRRHPATEGNAVQRRNLGFEPPASRRLIAAVHPQYLDQHRRILDTLLDRWKEFGVEVDVVTESMETFLRVMEDPASVDVALVRWSADYDDPDSFTYALFHSDDGLLSGFFSDPQADDLLLRARADVDPERRIALYHEFDALLEEQGVLLPLFHGVDCRIASPDLAQVRLGGSAPFLSYTHIARRREAAPTQAPRRGILNVPTAGILRTVDPHLARGPLASEILPSIFETLTKEVAPANVQPWLAREVIEELPGRRYRFRLREDVYFHDGRPLTARDVRYSFERLLRSSRRAAWTLAPIAGATDVMSNEGAVLHGFEISSSNEFVINLEQPVSILTSLLSHPATAIVPEGTGLTMTEAAELVGTGPFRVTWLEPGVQLELEAHRRYWRLGLPRSEGLIFSFGLDSAQIHAGFAAGEFSLAADLSHRDLHRLRNDSTCAAGYREVPGLATVLIVVNSRNGPFRSAAVRRAVLRRLADALSALPRPPGSPAQGVLPPGLIGVDDSTPGRRSRSRMDLGLTPGLRLTLAAQPGQGPEFERLSAAIIDSLRNADLAPHSISDSDANFHEVMDDGEPDLALLRWWADHPDADSCFFGLFHSQAGIARNLCGSSEIDTLIARGRIEADPRVRQSIYGDLERHLRREALVLPLFHEKVQRFAHPTIAGLRLNLTNPVVAYEELQLADGIR